MYITHTHTHIFYFIAQNRTTPTTSKRRARASSLHAAHTSPGVGHTSPGVGAPPRATSWTSPHLVPWLQPRRAVARGRARCSEVVRGWSRRRQYTTRRHPTSSPRARFSKYLEILPRRGDLERLLARRSRGLPRGGWRGGRGGHDLTSCHVATTS